MALIYEVKKMTLNFEKEKPVVYKVAAVRQQTVSYDALVKEVASSCGVHRTQTKAVVEGLLDRLVHYMDLGMPVRLEEFGTFKPSIQTKVKETAEEVDADNVVRRVVRFYPGKRMKEMLENLSIQTLERNYDVNNDVETGEDDEVSGGTDPDTGTDGNPL